MRKHVDSHADESETEREHAPLFTDGKPHTPREITRAYAEYRYSLYKKRCKDGKEL